MTLTRKKFLSDDELTETLALLNRHKGTRDSILIRLALFSGGRSCEVLALKPEDLHASTVTLYGAKGSNDRTVPLEPVFFAELQAFIQAKGLARNERIFPITTRHFRRIWSHWRPVRNPKLHGLRHTLGVKLYANSRNIHAVKTFLGQKNIKNTMIYLDFVEGANELRSEAEGMWEKKLG